MSNVTAKCFVSVIIAEDIEKHIDAEISVEVDYIIHQRDKMKLSTACDELLQLRHKLLKLVNKFYAIDAISYNRKVYLDSYLHEKIGKTIFYIKTTIYESEVND